MIQYGFKDLFGQHTGIKFQTSCMDPWVLDKVKKGEERWGRFKLALN